MVLLSFRHEHFQEYIYYVHRGETELFVMKGYHEPTSRGKTNRGRGGTGLELPRAVAGCTVAVTACRCHRSEGRGCCIVASSSLCPGTHILKHYYQLLSFYFFYIMGRALPIKKKIYVLAVF